MTNKKHDLNKIFQKIAQFSIINRSYVMQLRLMASHLLKMTPIASPTLNQIIHTSLTMQLLGENLHNNDLICDRIIKTIKSKAFISPLALKLEPIKLFLGLMLKFPAIDEN